MHLHIADLRKCELDEYGDLVIDDLRVTLYIDPSESDVEFQKTVSYTHLTLPTTPYV